MNSSWRSAIGTFFYLNYFAAIEERCKLHLVNRLLILQPSSYMTRWSTYSKFFSRCLCLIGEEKLLRCIWILKYSLKWNAYWERIDSVLRCIWILSSLYFVAFLNSAINILNMKHEWDHLESGISTRFILTQRAFSARQTINNYFILLYNLFECSNVYCYNHYLCALYYAEYCCMFIRCILSLFFLWIRWLTYMTTLPLLIYLTITLWGEWKGLAQNHPPGFHA